MQPTQHHVMIQQVAPPPSNALITKKSLNRQAVGLGIVQLILGCLCMIFNIAGIAIGSAVQYGATGIWIGVMFVITGPFGIVAGQKKLRGWYIAFMVLSIISACLVPGIIIQSSVGLAIEDDNWHYRYQYDYNDLYHTGYYTGYIGRSSYYYGEDPDRTAKMFLHGALLICALLELIIAIWSSVVCCYATCAGRKNNAAIPGQTVVYQSGGQPIVQPAQQVVMVNQPQPGMMVTTVPGVTVGPPAYGQQPPAGYPMATPPAVQSPPGEKNAI